MVVALLATLIALVVEQDFSPSHILLLASSSLCSASVASALLGTLMILIILTSQLLRVNPDNVATPIATSLGDLVTLGLQSLVAQGLFGSKGVGLVARGCPVDQMIGLQHIGLTKLNI